MDKTAFEILKEEYGISPALLELANRVKEEVAPYLSAVEATAQVNFARVLRGFQVVGITEDCLGVTSGYGYDDRGRNKLDELYAVVFGGEKGLVRSQMVSGTHALAVALYGLLRPGDELLSATGTPYDTLWKVIGIGKEGEKQPGSLRSLGVRYRQVEPGPSGLPSLEDLKNALNPRTRVVFIQRSRGYAWRPSLLLEDTGRLVEAVKRWTPHAFCVVDNCYGEFVEKHEPLEVGADVVAGSLIKNPGGGLCPTGGYVVGKAEAVDLAANRLTAPGLGSEVGPSLGFNRSIFQGFFLAPVVVAEAIKGVIFAAAICSRLGIEVMPGPSEPRGDIIQAFKMGSPERVVAFCEGIQSTSPVDSHVRPIPSSLPGYEDEVIMAAGTFVQGASIELSADAAMRPPYAVYLQGGLTSHHTEIAVLRALQVMVDRGLLDAGFF